MSWISKGNLLHFNGLDDLRSYEKAQRNSAVSVFEFISYIFLFATLLISVQRKGISIHNKIYLIFQTTKSQKEKVNRLFHVNSKMWTNAVAEANLLQFFADVDRNAFYDQFLDIM